MKHKNSTQTLRNIKPQKMKESSTLTSRTPKQHLRSSIQKKRSLSKIKSNPMMSSKETQYTNFPAKKCTYKSEANNETCHVLQHSTQTQSQLLNSISDRNHSGSKISLHSKIHYHEKEALKSNKGETNSVIKQRYQSKCSDSLNDIFKKTKNVFQQFRKKEEAWKKQKKCLLKEIQKYKNKSNRKNTSSNICIKGIKSV